MTGNMITKLAEAKAEAKRRWGPEGDAWGITPKLRVGFWPNDSVAPLQMIQGEGATWEEAFANSQPHKGHYHVCVNHARLAGLGCDNKVRCYKDCREMPKISAQWELIERGQIDYACPSCRAREQKAA